MAVDGKIADRYASAPDAVAAPSQQLSLTYPQALALGTLHGAAELLPISSSAHTILLPWLAGWRYQQIDPQLRKSVELALHAGTAFALLLGGGRSLVGSPRTISVSQARAIGVALIPPALAGYLLERPIENVLSTPPAVGCGLLLGGVAMAIADRLGARERRAAQASLIDGLVLGVAQACALAPGVSRNGATLSAARARGFTRQAASQLSWQAGLPVILGGSLLRAKRLRPRMHRADLRVAASGFAAAALASHLMATRVLAARREGSLAGYAAYRVGLAAVTFTALRRRSMAGRAGGVPDYSCKASGSTHATVA